MRRIRERIGMLPGSVFDLALISFVSLYLEMVVIRWLSSDIRVFAYFKNLPLLAAFLGLGLGCARGRGRPFWLVPVLFSVFGAIVAFADPLGLVHLYIPQADDTKFFQETVAYDVSTGRIALPPQLLAAKFIIVVTVLFFLVVELFAALGERLGALFNALPPNRAYSINLVASLLGIWAFAAASWLGWPPAGWFALAFLALLRFVFLWLRGRQRVVALGVMAVTLVLIALAPGASHWTPYYRLDVTPYLVPGADGGRDTAGYRVAINHDMSQVPMDLSDGFVETHPDGGLEAWRLNYYLPYRFAHPRRVLVVGAGTGNDVAAALRHGAEQVDAVEIDPAILQLGGELHPEHPYASPRVRLINDDARSFFTRSHDEYDLIVFGYLDSVTLLSSMSSLRLDHYVYTLESIQQARALLAPGGHLALSFSTYAGGSGREAWLAGRLYQIVTTVFGEEPIAIGLEDGVLTLFMIGPGVREQLAADPEMMQLAIDPTQLRSPVPLTTDDWPFLYLRDRGVPVYPYGLLLVVLLLGGGGLVVLSLRSSGVGLDIPMFLLGAAFMLIEVKSISQLSLLFGSTWLVNAFVISAVLILALLSNLYVARWRPSRVGPAYALLMLALVVDYLLPLGVFSGLDAAAKATLGTLPLVLPLLFAGVVFATLFARTKTPGHAFGSNLLGALAGGLLEYASMATGFKALGLLALVLYAASWIALQRWPRAGLVTEGLRRRVRSHSST